MADQPIRLHDLRRSGARPRRTLHLVAGLIVLGACVTAAALWGAQAFRSIGAKTSPDGAETVREEPAAPATLQPATIQPAPATPAGEAAKPAGIATSTPGASAPAGSPAAELRAADALLAAREFARARAKLDAVLATGQDEYASQAAYRIGYAARLEGDSAAAIAAWTDALKRWPDRMSGRLSAIGLADLKAATSPAEEVRDLYSLGIGRDNAPFLPAEVRTRIVGALNRLNDSLVFSPAPCTGATFHTVEPGEMLVNIARKYGVHYASICSINRLDPKRMRPGMKIKILKGECEIVVHKRDLTLTWFLDGKWIRQFPCCVGPDNKTPAGEYVIDGKAENPPWTSPIDGQRYEYGDPKNILGTRWMALKGGQTSGLGIHGTTVPESIPGRTSMGCVRLLNKDVEELYGFALNGSKVVILD